MNKFAMCSSTDPKTCFEASNAQILSGRCGRSRHLLYTSDRRASAPRAACINRAKGPSRRHSPFSAPGREWESLEFEIIVATAVADGSMIDMAGCTITVGRI